MRLLLSSYQTGENCSTLCRDSVSTGDFSGTQFASAGLREKVKSSSKSLGLFASKETLTHCPPYPVPLEAVWKRQDVARAVLLFGQRHHRKSVVTPFPGCAGSFFEDAKSDFQQALKLDADFEDAKVSLQQTLLDQQEKIHRGY
ncbi:hypothetical protein ATANTOWER_016638 [Ataeniobius toweri]|uniref:Uncharacterized protein n=1 Tax=Ataeniobius toweri TaxID=208326 RepID=A0ABU7BQ32_9TELE|nr:hypothetical protein [Ataeniobius toweri]